MKQIVVSGIGEVEVREVPVRSPKEANAKRLRSPDAAAALYRLVSMGRNFFSRLTKSTTGKSLLSDLLCTPERISGGRPN